MEDVLIAVYGIDVTRQMIALDANFADNPKPGETVQADIAGAVAQPSAAGFISRPGLSRANRSHMTFFVNGRAVQDRSLAFAVTEAYHTFLTVGRYPLSIIMIRVPPEDVDVNVHPTKAEVRFRDPHRVFSVVQRLVRATLLSTGQAPTLANPHLLSTDFERQTSLRSLGSGSARNFDNVTMQSRGYQLDFGPTASDAQRQGLSTLEDELRHEATNDATHANLGAKSETEVESEPFARSLPLLRVLGQVARTYIIAEGPEGIFLIDQHAAHERVLYERLARQRLSRNGDRVASQVLLDPIIANLTPRQRARLAEQLDLFHSVGFMLEPFGATDYLIRAVPDILADGDPRTALSHILDEMADEREEGTGEHANPVGTLRKDALIASVCKQSAIKGGRLLTMPEMQELIQQLEQCEAPRTCPHGRPTVVRLGLEQLAREFRRT
jgi:DNA mismatch repair protein MutL